MKAVAVELTHLCSRSPQGKEKRDIKALEVHSAY